MEVLAPIQEGANRALKPFRDLFGWVGDTLDAKDQPTSWRPRTRRSSAGHRLQAEQGRERAAQAASQEMNTSGGLDAYEPVNARVIARSPSSLYSDVTIDKGSSDGVRVDQPVVNGAGLVGKVKEVSDGNAVVMLITDPEFGVSANTLASGEPGSVASRCRRSPGDLRFELVQNAKEVRAGDRSSPPAPAPRPA